MTDNDTIPDLDGFVLIFGEKPDPYVDLRAYLTWHQRLIMLMQWRHGIKPLGVERSLDQIARYEFPDGTIITPLGTESKRRWIRHPVNQPLPLDLDYKIAALSYPKAANNL